MLNPSTQHPSEEWPPPLSTLIQQAERIMYEALYEYTTIRIQRIYWKRLLDFATQRGHAGPLENTLIEDWLAEEGYPVGAWPRPRPPRLSIRLTALRILVQVHEFRAIVPGYVLDPRYRFAHPGGCSEGGGAHTITAFGQGNGELRAAALSEPFRQAFQAYEEDCRQRGFRPTTLKNAQLYIPRLLHNLIEQGVSDVSGITPVHISTYLTSLQGYAPRTVSHYSCHARCLLRFLHQRGMIAKDLSVCVPPAPIRHYARIPTVWTRQEVERLLAQVDRGSPRGKRDYAILLLAARIGMRVSDIIRLTLDEVKWEQKRIELIQSKTQQPLTVPLLDDIGWALIDYLKHARPISTYRQVFLRLMPPYAPFVSNDNLHYIITRYRRMAGIQRFQHQPVGLHTLRHSLATQLLADDVPLSTISEVLGHVCQASTEVYAKVDVRHLQQCPLDPEEVIHAST